MAEVFAACRKGFAVPADKSGMTKKLSPELAAKEWIALKADKFLLDQKLEELRAVLEPYLNEQPERSAELAGFKFTLVTQERESFKLKDAKKKIDGRTLQPYITVSTSTQIRTTWRGGEDEAAA